MIAEELGGQVLSGDAGVPDDEDSLQRLAIRQTLAAREPKAPLLPRRNSGSINSHSSSDTIHGAVAIGTLPA
jgi:hypothetical protein